MRVPDSRSALGRFGPALFRSAKKLISYTGIVATILGLSTPWNLAQAVSDTTPPTVASATLVSGNTFVSEETNNTIFLTVHVTDDLSGITSPLLQYVSPSGHQSYSGSVVGGSGPGFFDYAVSLPPFVETGVWTPRLTVSDISGNARTLNGADLIAAGFNLDVTVTGNGDTTAPVLDYLSLTSDTSQSIDGALGATITTSGKISDAYSGLSSPTMTFSSPSGQQALTTHFDFPDPADHPGEFTTSTTILQYAEAGVWKPTLILMDAVGNTVTLSDDDLKTRGINLETTITGSSDILPPNVDDLNIGLASPLVDNFPNGSAVVTVYAQFTDNLSGMSATTHLSYTSPSGNQHVDAQLTGYVDNVWQLSATLPAYSESGTWQPTLYVADVVGNTRTYNGSDLAGMGFPIAIAVTKNITKTAAANETVTSDEENDGATTTDPVEVAITTPNAGDVSIVIVASDAVADPTNGYTFFDRQISIIAPGAAPENPLTLAFRIDSSKIPVGESASTLQVTRNGSTIPACTGLITADPNPCIFSRTTLGDGDILVKVHSTSASVWASGFPTHVYDFAGFKKPTLALPSMNQAHAGQVVPVRFAVRGVNSTDILAPGQPVSQQINCSSKAKFGQVAPALSPTGLTKGGNNYEYTWRTDKAWNNTCREFTVTLKDHSVHSVQYHF